MLIDDKAVASAIKKSKTGVKVRYMDGELQIVCGEWVAMIEVGAVKDKPKLTLAALVEMLGYIPEGECLNLQKGKDDYAAQNMMDGAFLSEVSGYVSAPEAVTVAAIPLAYGMTMLYQAEDMRVVGVKPDELRICADRSAPRYSEELSTFICNDNSVFACRALRGETAAWRALESFRWTSSGNDHLAEDAEDDDGQMEMEDSDE